MATNGRRMTGPDPETVEEGLVAAARIQEVALNDHAVCLAQAIRDAAPEQDTAQALWAISEAINNLAEAIREGNARR